jgi:hypothetical protein
MTLHDFVAGCCSNCCSTMRRRIAKRGAFNAPPGPDGTVTTLGSRRGTNYQSTCISRNGSGSHGRLLWVAFLTVRDPPTGKSRRCRASSNSPTGCLHRVVGVRDHHNAVACRRAPDVRDGDLLDRAGWVAAPAGADTQWALNGIGELESESDDRSAGRKIGCAPRQEATFLAEKRCSPERIEGSGHVGLRRELRLQMYIPQRKPVGPRQCDAVADTLFGRQTGYDDRGRACLG